MSERMKGKVKWFSNERCYGFIAPDNGSNEVFVHYTAIIAEGFRTLEENQKVEFTIVQGERGPQAKDVQVIQ